jgi:hypothetical protein
VGQMARLQSGIFTGLYNWIVAPLFLLIRIVADPGLRLASCLKWAMAGASLFTMGNAVLQWFNWALNKATAYIAGGLSNVFGGATGFIADAVGLCSAAVGGFGSYITDMCVLFMAYVVVSIYRIIKSWIPTVSG